MGGGNMGKAIIAGALRGGARPSGIAVSEPDAKKREEFAGLGLGVFDRVQPAMEWLRAMPGEGQVLLAVKPQVFAEVARDASAALAGLSCVVMSILAGVTSERIERAIPGARAVRLMPNLPAQVGMGVTAMCRGSGARVGDDVFARSLFESVGRVIEIDESLMDAFTAVAGSGPAYGFLLAEAMEAGARRVGFDGETARSIVLGTIRGAAEMMARSGDAPADLRARVTSKGGTTEAALRALDTGEIVARFERAIEAARDRGRELAGW